MTSDGRQESLELMSENGMAWRADRRAQLDLQINLLAEQESTRTVVPAVADRGAPPGSSRTDADRRLAGEAD
jgi:hypothetical protein